MRNTTKSDESIMLALNALDQSTRTKMAQAISGGYDYADTLHNVYLDYGYPFELTFSNFWNMYRRGGVAKRVVSLYPEQTWLDDPIVKTSAQVSNDLDLLIEKGLWRRLQAVDTRQRVGRYAGLFMRVRDGKMPDQPIDGQLAGLNSLVQIVPLYESQLVVLETDDNPMSDNYGQPILYQFSGTADGSRSDDTPSTFNIHHTRVITAAEGADNGSIYGIPSLECVYNALLDLRKIIGGGAEGFYRNASQSIVFDVKDPKVSAMHLNQLEGFSDQIDDFVQNRMRRSLMTPGLEANSIESNLISSKDFANDCIAEISAGASMPSSLLIGNQTGRLAGDQDSKGFLSQVQARRETFGTELVTSTIDWLMMWGILPTAAYEIEWPDAMAPSSEEKLLNADKMADINSKQYMSAGTIPFTGEEIREAAGFDMESEEEDDFLDEPDENEEEPTQADSE